MLLALIGCSSANDALSTETIFRKQISVNVTLPQSESRVTITPDSQSTEWLVEWSEGDAIAACATGSVDRLTIDAGSVSAGAATFSGDASAELVRLAYPYPDVDVDAEGFSFDLSSQSFDYDAPYDHLGSVVPLVSDAAVDVSVENPTAYMRHVGAVLQLHLKFTDLEEDATYRVERIKLLDVASKATFELEGDVEDDDFLTTSGSYILLDIEDSPALVEGDAYTYNFAILPFEVAAGDSLSFSLRFSKVDSAGEESSFDCQYTVTNDSGASIDLARAQYHSLYKVCVVDTSAELYASFDDLHYGYAEELTTMTIDEVDFDYYYLGRLVNAAPFQLKTKVGYFYNTTPLEWLTKLVINVWEEGNSYSGHAFTVYAGTTPDSKEKYVAAVDGGSTLTYNFPAGCSYFSIYNESSNAAYAIDFTLYYGSANGAIESEPYGDPDTPTDNMDDSLSALNETSPYNIAYGARWVEVPSYVNDEDYIYLTHWAEVNESTVRNYSLCFVPEYRAAIWVAFPYHEIYDGDSSRTEDWEFDPLIDEALQADLDSAYSTFDGQTYDRGHQISSGDRLGTDELNSQTFYYSNMTPQNSSLNRGQWSSLEDKVRKQVCSDTLYVVTGADFSSIIGYVTDESENECPIPTAYYKVMLRTRSGESGKSINECSADELQSIGYWVENIYTGVLPDPVTVSEIEEKTGLTFFPTIPAEVKEQLVKSYWTDL